MLNVEYIKGILVKDARCVECNGDLYLRYDKIVVCIGGKESEVKFFYQKKEIGHVFCSPVERGDELVINGLDGLYNTNLSTE